MSENNPDLELKEALDGIDWPIEYGIIKLRIEGGRITLITIERTIKAN